MNYYRRITPELLEPPPEDLEDEPLLGEVDLEGRLLLFDLVREG